MKYRCIRKKSKFLVFRHFGVLFSPRLTWEKPESSIFNKLSTLVTPIFTGVTTFYESISIE